ncbi:DsbA family protein [Arcobacter sp.]|uniref:DsbA family protein n=1 Tax=Arcobacter sp. TaxID=1872629 RepID=UPI003D10354A
MKNKLYYIHDPMCSWCYAFKKDYVKLKKRLPSNIEVINIVGGLAKDTNEPMPKEMQEKIASIWHEIEKMTGTKFNHKFWEECSPRRSTYLACKAVLCAKEQNKENEMIDAIQRAYYQKAQNPSDEETLVNIANELLLDKDKFIADLKSEKIEKLFQDDLEKRRELKVFSFPSLVLQYKKELYPINIKYNKVDEMLRQIENLSSNIYF